MFAYAVGKEEILGNHFAIQLAHTFINVMPVSRAVSFAVAGLLAREYFIAFSLRIVATNAVAVCIQQ